MGLNITIQTATGAHPAWDGSRYGYDRDFAKLFFEQPCVELGNMDPYFGFDPLYRPADFEQMREVIRSSGIGMQERFFLLLELVEADPQSAIRFGH